MKADKGELGAMTLISSYNDFGSDKKCCSERPEVCLAGQLCKLPTPDCPSTDCSEPTGSTGCAECTSYSTGSWIVSYFSVGTNTVGSSSSAWTPTSGNTFKAEVSGPPTNRNSKTKGKITVVVLFTDGGTVPECVRVKIDSVASTWLTNIWSCGGSTNNFFGDPEQLIFGPIGNIQQRIREGSRTILLSVDVDPASPTYKEARFELEVDAEMIANGPPNFPSGYAQVVVLATVVTF